MPAKTIPTRTEEQKEAFRAAAIAGGWRHSPADDGWIHDDEIRLGEHQVRSSAEDACWLHDIEVDLSDVTPPS